MHDGRLPRGSKQVSTPGGGDSGSGQHDGTAARYCSWDTTPNPGEVRGPTLGARRDGVAHDGADRLEGVSQLSFVRVHGGTTAKRAGSCAPRGCPATKTHLHRVSQGHRPPTAGSVSRSRAREIRARTSGLQRLPRGFEEHLPRRRGVGEPGIRRVIKCRLSPARTRPRMVGPEPRTMDGCRRCKKRCHPRVPKAIRIQSC